MHESSISLIFEAAIGYSDLASNILLSRRQQLSLHLLLVRTVDIHAMHIIRSVYISCGHSAKTPLIDSIIKVKGYSSSRLQ